MNNDAPELTEPVYILEMSLSLDPWRRKDPGTGRGRVLRWKSTEARTARCKARLLALFGTVLLISMFSPRSLAHPLPLKDEPVPGWPDLHIETHYVARIAMRGFCFPVPAGTPIPDTSLDSCARPDFWRGVCDIYIDVQYTGSARLRAHEEKRCRGYDRQHDDFLADALRAWRERGENKYADMLDFESMLFVLEGSLSGPIADEESTR